MNVRMYNEYILETFLRCRGNINFTYLKILILISRNLKQLFVEYYVICKILC